MLQRALASFSVFSSPEPLENTAEYKKSSFHHSLAHAMLSSDASAFEPSQRGMLLVSSNKKRAAGHMHSSPSNLSVQLAWHSQGVMAHVVYSLFLPPNC
jgi:hypothetical protein